jgi:hypothetical protein
MRTRTRMRNEKREERIGLVYSTEEGRMDGRMEA